MQSPVLAMLGHLQGRPRPPPRARYTPIIHPVDSTHPTTLMAGQPGMEHHVGKPQDAAGNGFSGGVGGFAGAR